MNAARVIVTGSTSGIGKEIALRLALRGAEVILACRDPQCGQEAADAIREHASAAQPVVMAVDTSSQASISDFAREYRQRYDRLDALVNNAGTLCYQRNTNGAGLDSPSRPTSSATT